MSLRGNDNEPLEAALFVALLVVVLFGLALWQIFGTD